MEIALGFLNLLLKMAVSIGDGSIWGQLSRASRTCWTCSTVDQVSDKSAERSWINWFVWFASFALTYSLQKRWIRLRWWRCYRLFFATSQTAHLYLQQMALLGFYLTPMPRQVFSREKGEMSPSWFEPTSELHRTRGTFQRMLYRPGSTTTAGAIDCREVRAAAYCIRGPCF